jgi:tRNA threonylcarbamoyl adenosine modification protein YeaZ
MLLAFDTATPTTTVAVVAGDEVLAERSHVDSRGHAEVLVPLVRDVLAVSGVTISTLSAIAVGIGPGAYTGLRVGLVTAHALGASLGVPVRGVVTLDAMAEGSGLSGRFAVVTDARRRELFWATYDGPRSRLRGPDVGPPDTVAQLLVGLPVVGAAGTPFADWFPDVRGGNLPSAGSLGRLASAELAAGDAPRAPSPIYLRRPDVTPAHSTKPVTQR